MEDQELEIRELQSKIQELNESLSTPEDLPQQFSILQSQIQSLQKEILETKSLIRQQNCQKLINQSKNPFPKPTSPASKPSYIQKLTEVISSFQGKATIHAQLKKLLQKEKENIQIRAKLASIQRTRSDLSKAYSEITKKLTEDNDLTKRVKLIEDQIPQLINLVDFKRKDLGKIRAQTQEIKLNKDDKSFSQVQSKISQLQLSKSETYEKVSALKAEVSALDSLIFEATSQKSSSKSSTFDLDKLEVKTLELQLVEKEKELNFLARAKKEVLLKLQSSQKSIIKRK